LTIVLALAASGLASASIRRYAVVVGNDYSASEQAPLHYAEKDASRMARLLEQLGGVEPGDLSLLRGLGVPDLRGAIERVRGHAAADRRSHPGRRSMLLFYFSGHSDGVALELGADRLPFQELRTLLASTGADVRVAVVDSCRSGALLATKGSRPGPAFDIDVVDGSSAEGTVLLTSSAANEEALESRDIGGSFFTESLLTGLRGAADSSGDGRVTLAEAYRYSYAQTVATTSDTLLGTQHPGYDFRLSGVGEVVLTELGDRTASLSLPAGFDRALVVDATRQEVAAELSAGVVRPLAFVDGTYRVKAWRGPKLYEGTVALQAGEHRSVGWTDLAAAEAPGYADAKGAGGVSAAEGDLKRAIELMNSFEDEKATDAFRALLKGHPDDGIAARAHLYLGILQLNATHASQAREEFKQALLADPTLELPPGGSPKARLALGEARRTLSLEVEAAPVVDPAASGADSAPAPAAAVEANGSKKPAEKSHVLAITLGSIGVAAIAVAVYGGVEVLNYDSDASSSRSTPNQISSSQLSGTNASFWRYGWIVAGALGAAGLASAAFTW
jgi:hypothetical protein